MVDFAQKLMNAAQIWGRDELPSPSNSMLKTNVYHQKSLYRIGLWPIKSVSGSDIGIGMGIGMVLAALLEQWPSVCVYRLMTKLGEPTSDYQWKIEDTQFGVDDWEIEGLDENIAIWGRFTLQNDQLTLSLEVENDAREDDSVLELNYESDTVGEILNQLPVIVTEIMNWLSGASISDVQRPYEIITSVNAEPLGNFLEDIFLWEVDYFLELWGQGTDANEVLQNQYNLIAISENLDCDFGAWMTAQAISRFTLFDQSSWNALVLPTIKETASSLSKYPIASVILATTVFRLDDLLDAFDLLETSLLLHPKYSESWIVLGNMYIKSAEDLSAIDVYQRAIEADVATSEIYLEYASLMDSLVEHQIDLKEGVNRVSAAGRPFIERYILTDSTADSPSLRESCASYRRVVELDHSNVDALAHLVTGLLALHDPETWEYCIQLVNVDEEGAITSTLIEQLGDDDLHHITRILQAACETKPKALGVHLNLARAYLADGQNEKAKRELETFSISDLPQESQSDFSRLRLAAADTGFAHRIREIQDTLNAKGRVNTEDVDLLEGAIEKEPLFSEGYRLLAESYLNWNEPDDALEVLLDGQKTAPFDSELVALLAKVLWDADESDLAFAYLDQGLSHNTRNPTLLSLMGRFLFENGEDETAKEYLRRAEAIDPLNEELSNTRLYVANSLVKFKK